MDEARLVGVESREREPQDEFRNVLGTVLRYREEEQFESPAGVVVEPAEQAEIEQREPTVGCQQHVPSMRIGVVDALGGHLPNVEAKQNARELAGAVRIEPMCRRHLLAPDQLQHENAFRDIGANHRRDDEVSIVGGERRDQLRVVGLLFEVELGAEVHLELVR